MRSRRSRRAFLGAASTAVTAGLVAGCDAGSGGRPAAPAQVSAVGPHQAGIVDPPTAQQNVLAVVADIAGDADLGGLLASLGKSVLALTEGADARLFGIPPGDLTVTVGLGPRVVRLAGSALPGAMDLPRFSGERIAANDRGGDLLLQFCASDALLLPIAAEALLGAGGGRLRERWRQTGRRGPDVALGRGRTAPRNLLGFVDGIVGPHTAAERDRDLWLAGPRPVEGGTIVVLRRMELDLSRFAGLSTSEQEAVMGRHRRSGAPLDGGPVTAGPNLGAKTPDGRYLVPVDAHARRANPNLIGVGLMLRRSYSIDQPAPGLLFTSFQNELRTFTATLTNMERSDALLEFTSTTASATFLVLPGFDRARPLGAGLFRD